VLVGSWVAGAADVVVGTETAAAGFVPSARIAGATMGVTVRVTAAVAAPVRLSRIDRLRMLPITPGEARFIAGFSCPSAMTYCEYPVNALVSAQACASYLIRSAHFSPMVVMHG
jgi:hypothetical protein